MPQRPRQAPRGFVQHALHRAVARYTLFQKDGKYESRPLFLLADHLPLYRMERIFTREGVSISRGSMCGWLARCADLLRPLYQVMVEEVLQSWVIQTDDTPVRVLNEGPNRSKLGRLWDYWGDAYHPYIVYDYTPNREQTGPQAFLRGYLGYLQADGYTGYDGLYAKGFIIEVACWAHTRRKFYEARETDPERATYALAVIQQLYRVEKQANEAIAADHLCLEDGWWLRLRYRQEQSVPLLNQLKEWLDKQRDQVLPKSPIAEAIGYALNQWSALFRYQSQGYLAIDNNAAERSLRAVAVGRKNYLFFGSDVGGRSAAVLYSFTQTCLRLHIEPWRYLRDVLERLPTWPSERLGELLPDRWAETHWRAMTTGPPAPSPHGISGGSVRTPRPVPPRDHGPSPLAAWCACARRAAADWHIPSPPAWRPPPTSSTTHYCTSPFKRHSIRFYDGCRCSS